jgi:RNA polymerase sigma factor (TIGR02999 family)
MLLNNTPDPMDHLAAQSPRVLGWDHFQLQAAFRGAVPNNRQAVDDLFSTTYEELKRLAARVRRGDPSNTLSTTALVNEAYLKLARSFNFTSESQLHFKRIAARAMRQLLVEAARRRNSNKRGGGRLMITLDESVSATSPFSEDVLALDAALNNLARMNPRQALMVEYRFFGGLDLDETARALEVSESTIDRDWRAARAWLASELHQH